jgi:hypothetical protein
MRCVRDVHYWRTCPLLAVGAPPGTADRLSIHSSTRFLNLSSGWNQTIPPPFPRLLSHGSPLLLRFLFDGWMGCNSNIDERTHFEFRYPEPKFFRLGALRRVSPKCECGRNATEFFRFVERGEARSRLSR